MEILKKCLWNSLKASVVLSVVLFFCHIRIPYTLAYFWGDMREFAITFLIFLAVDLLFEFGAAFVRGVRGK